MSLENPYASRFFSSTSRLGRHRLNSAPRYYLVLFCAFCLHLTAALPYRLAPDWRIGDLRLYNPFPVVGLLLLVVWVGVTLWRRSWRRAFIVLLLYFFIVHSAISLISQALK